MTDITDPIFHDVDKARAHLESLRWPDGPICPHCGTINNATEMTGKSHRKGVYKCKEKECRKPFSVTVGEKVHLVSFRGKAKLTGSPERWTLERVQEAAVSFYDLFALLVPVRRLFPAGPKDS